MFPYIIDAEKDDITDPFVTLTRPFTSVCKCVHVRHNISLPNPIWLEIDRKYIGIGDIGNYQIEFGLVDNKYNTSFQKSIYIVDFYIDYSLPVDNE